MAPSYFFLAIVRALTRVHHLPIRATVCPRPGWASRNASTDMEVTEFHLDCSQRSFAGALDRFAQFFVAPLIRADSTDRELNSIESGE